MIVGTAGHIDHGKTALVKALTGVDADRLAEERERGISIDLGFAYLDRPDGSTMGFVDVPGHERFMRNMLAGATGIDCVLLVVAADDGVMPQTREHLAVVELLGLARGVVALTKCDMVDKVRQEEVAGNIRELLARGLLSEAEIFPVSSLTGEGVADLLAALDLAAEAAPKADDPGRFRFAVDRCFSLQGVGTVATGVVWSGRLGLGDVVTASPSGIEARVRALHVQNKPAQAARRGDRCGINLAGKVDPTLLNRGDFLIDPFLHAPSDRIDAELSLLADEPRALRQWVAVRVHHAAIEVPARLALLQEMPIAPGEHGRVQIVLERPIAAAVGDRFVIRDAAGSRTMGGGRFLDLRPPQRRRRQPRRVAQLDAMAIADPVKSLVAQLTAWPWHVDRDRFIRDHALSAEAAAAVLAAVPHEEVRADGPTFLFGNETWESLRCSAIGEVSLFHKRYPQCLGPNLQRLAGALGPRLTPKASAAFLTGMVEHKLLARESGVYRLPTHKLGLDRADDDVWQQLRPLLGGEARFRPPRVGELAEITGRRDFDVRRVFKSMSKQGAVVEVATDHFFLREVMAQVARIVGELASAAEDGYFGAAQLRDRLDNGRKVSIQLLEYFDRQGLTLRRGDLRIIDPRRLERYVDGNLEVAQ
jgi:selenocysteine-specific elongation factor